MFSTLLCIGIPGVNPFLSLHVNGENTPNPPILENEDPGTFSLYCNLTNEYVDTVSQQNVVFVVFTGVA